MSFYDIPCPFHTPKPLQSLWAATEQEFDHAARAVSDPTAGDRTGTCWEAVTNLAWKDPPCAAATGTAKYAAMAVCGDDTLVHTPAGRAIRDPEPAPKYTAMVRPKSSLFVRKHSQEAASNPWSGPAAGSVLHSSGYRRGFGQPAQEHFQDGQGFPARPLLPPPWCPLSWVSAWVEWPCPR